jgi:hypothetical protein
MRKFVRFIGVSVFLFASVLPSAAAASGYVEWSYNPSVPIGSVRKFTADASPRGLEYGGAYLPNRNFSIGLAVNWYRLYETAPYATYLLPTGAITGTLHRSVESIAGLAQLRWYTLPDGFITPFVGLGLGAAFTQFSVAVSDLEPQSRQGSFVFTTEAGGLVTLDRGEYYRLALWLGLRYQFNTASFGDVSNVQTAALHFGIHTQFD